MQPADTRPPSILITDSTRAIGRGLAQAFPSLDRRLTVRRRSGEAASPVAIASLIYFAASSLWHAFRGGPPPAARHPRPEEPPTRACSGQGVEIGRRRC